MLHVLFALQAFFSKLEYTLKSPLIYIYYLDLLPYDSNIQNPNAHGMEHLEDVWIQ